MKIASLVLFCSLLLQGMNNVQYKMYIEALKNESTAPNYVLIKVTNLNDNETKDICTEAPFLEGAIFRELALKYDNKSEKKVKRILTQNKDLHFYFKNPKALENINFFDYDTTQLRIVGNKYRVSNIINTVINHKMFDYTFEGEHDEQVYLAHLLIQKGIMVGRGCIAGNLLSMQLFSE